MRWPWVVGLLGLWWSEPARSVEPPEGSEEGDAVSPRRDKRKVRYEPREPIDFGAASVLGEIVMPWLSRDLPRAVDHLLLPDGRTFAAEVRGRSFVGLVYDGEIPASDLLSVEDLFLRNDVRVTPRACVDRLCVDVVPASIVALPRVDHLLQVGFVSGPSNGARPPLDLVLVLDLSLSMRWDGLELLRHMLYDVASQLDDRDRVTIVGFDGAPRLLLPATRGDARPAIEAVADGLVAGGDTDVATGMSYGVELAVEARADGYARRRLVLVTDALYAMDEVTGGPLVSLAQDAAAAGVGVTTLGIGTRVDPRWAATMVAVPGGDVVTTHWPYGLCPSDPAEALWTEERAADLRVELIPTRGARIGAVYGVPERSVERTKGGGVAFRLDSALPSVAVGCVFVAIDAGKRDVTGPLATATASYTSPDGARRSTTLEVSVGSEPIPSPLVRAAVLVDLATGVRRALTLHERGRDQRAVELLDALVLRHWRTSDGHLDDELDVARDLRSLIAAAVAGP